MKSRLLVASLALLVSCSSHAAVVVVAPPPTVVDAPQAPTLCDDRLPPPAAAVAHVPAPWPFDVESYSIGVEVDASSHSMAGNGVIIHVTDEADGLTVLPLDAVDMTIEHVRGPMATHEPEDPGPEVIAPGPDVPFTYDGGVLRIALDEPRRIGRKREFHIGYSAHPSRGVYFNDGSPAQVYSQGECEDSRYWFPCHDAPDDRATSRMLMLAPAAWQVVGNGTEASSEKAQVADGRGRRHHVFQLDVPHVAYLNSFVAGEYDVIDAPGVVPLQFVVEKRDAPYAAACFRKTDDVLRFFGDYTGLPYPYPKYSQTCVRNFMFGGMENISATTLTDHAIHPPDWEQARSSTSLVAHEAAHQWFGDWITCSDWSHCWLNEGFATYFDALFTEHDEGRDAFLWTLRGLRYGGLGAMDGERRAVVSNVWADPFDLFDGHAYPGAAARLHMLRHHLGDEQFKGAIRHYVKKCGLQCITTDDFQKAVEEFTGQDLAWFFDQWFRKPGYPVLKVRWKWDEAKKAEIVTVEQTHKAEGGAPEAYRLALDIAFDPHHLPLTQRRIELTKRSETFEFPMPAEPQCVRPDPNTALLARFDLDRSSADLATVALGDGNASVRFEAAEALAGIVRDDKRPPGDRDAAHLTVLAAFQAEAFAPARAALAGIVATRKDDGTAQTLIDAMNGDADLRVRLAASDTLHGFEGNAKARDALVPHLQDGNDLMRASAVAGMARLKHPQAYDSLAVQVEIPGWQSVARVAALRGFADLGDERAFATLVRFAAPGDNWSRTTAIDSLGRMGKGKPAYRDAVLPYLDDSERGVRQTAASALGAIADPDTLPTLVAHFHTETWPAVKDALRNAIKAVRAAGVVEGRLVSVEAVRASEIRDHHAALRDEIEAFEPTVKTLTGEAKTAAETKLKSMKDQLAQAQRSLDELGVPVKAKPAPPAAK